MDFISSFFKKVSEYDREIQQIHTTDQLTTQGGIDTEQEQSQDTRKTIQVKQPALSSKQDHLKKQTN